MDPYLLLRWLHILSSTVLFGTGIGTAFQMVMAMRSGKVETVHSVASAVVIADWLFTTPAGVLQPLTGIALIYRQGWSLTEPWLLATYVLYLIALAAWVPVVVLQIRIRNLSHEALTSNRPLPEEAERLYRMWFILGWPAFIALMGVFWLMIAKPQFG